MCDLEELLACAPPSVPAPRETPSTNIMFLLINGLLLVALVSSKQGPAALCVPP